MTSRGRRAGAISVVSLVVLVALLVTGVVWAAPPSAPPGLDRAIAVQEAHTDALLAHPGVVGTAVGVAADGQPVVKIYTRTQGVRGLPSRLDGVPVEVEVTGEFEAQAADPGSSSGTERLIVYRGLLYCTVGTLGAIVKDANNIVYALSNAHVYANAGSKTYGAVVTGASGDRILQPGRVDLQPACGDPAQFDDLTIARLSAYKAITFSRTASNAVDAAIAKLENQTNYAPGAAAPVAATPGQVVEKQGRTTGLTQGTVTAVNATVYIKYDTGTARFVRQIVVQGNNNNDPAFSAGGDSGSLIVTSSGNHPVALLFAGSSSTTIGNPIQEVLDAFSGHPGLTIVGQ